MNTDQTKTGKLIIVAALALVPLLYFYPAFTGESSLAPGDGWFQNFGVRALVGKMLAGGFLPLWNPYIFAGMPLLASTYPGALYPPNWVFAIFSPGVAMKIVVITTYHLALAGTYLYLRRVGVERLGAFVGGLGFTFGGFMIAHMGHTSRIAAAAWLPWVLLATERLYQQVSWRWIALGALFFGLQLIAGEPQMSVYTALTAGAYVLFSSLFRPPESRRWRFPAATAAMVICGVLLAAIAWEPARELVRQSGRAKLTYEFFSSFSMPPRQVVSLIFPYFFGGAVSKPYILAPWGPSDWGADNVGVSCGYVGMLVLLLGLAAVLGRRRERLVIFWGGVAALSLILALGAWLPFEMNQILYRIPVYNLFRGSYRHLLEFTFAASVLAGFGVDCLARREKSEARSAWLRGAVALGLMVAATTIVYCFFWEYLLAGKPRPPQFGSITNAEALIPISFFVLSVFAARVYLARRTAAAAVALVILLIADLAAFGHAFEWRNATFDANALLADPPSVKAIKSRESDLNSFRILSHGALPFVENYEALDFPNVGIARGLQSVNGYDVLQSRRLAEITGEMTSEGIVQESSAFDPNHQGFNLLNVRYLLGEKRVPLDEWHGEPVEGILFSRAPLSLKLRPGAHVEMALDGADATELAVISSMANSAEIPDGTPVVSARLYTRDGRVIERELQAGRDTSEWAWDRADVKSVIRHPRAHVAESWEGGGFQGHRYLARLTFDRAQVDRAEFDFLRSDARQLELIIERASLYDAQSKNSTPLDSRALPPTRWRRLESFGPVDLYENLKALPRAWFVRRTEVMPGAEVLDAIRQGKLKDARPFDPSETALLEREDFGGRDISLPPVGDTAKAEARVTRYEPQRIELATRNPQPGFLVLSEMYYRGWEAWIDGRRTPVERANYVLRGIAVPAGDHRIEFVFRSPSFRIGAVWSLLGVIILLVGAGASSAGTRRLGEHLATQLIILIRRLGPWRICLLLAMALYGIFLFRHAAYAVGGSDGSGYANTARYMLAGKIVQPVEILDSLGLPESFILDFLPLAHVRGPRPGTMAPFYPPGMSLHMALGTALIGWKNGPFLISPLAALFSLVLIYLVGLEIGLPRAYSLAGAVMLAVCPFFIFFALQPMSDVLATAWTLATILATLRSRQNERWGLLAGAAFGMAVLVRPANALLLPVLFCLRRGYKWTFPFMLGGLPLAIVFFAFNYAAYGRLLQTGYGHLSASEMVKLSNFPARFNYYVYWLAMTMGPLTLLGWLGAAANPVIKWRDRALLIMWFGVFFIFYCCYQIYDAWWYTRFLMPGIPALILGSLLSARHLAGMLSGRIAARLNQRLWNAITIGVLVITSLSFGLYIINRFDITSWGSTEYTHPRSCKWADRQLPNKALVVAMEMSGALRFYTNRPSVRWDWVDADQWQVLKTRAAEKGFHWYALLMPHEIEEARKRIPGRWNPLGQFGPISLWQIETDP